MSNESSATNWIVGCAVAGALGIVVCMGGAFALFGWGFRAQRQVVQEVQQAQMEMAQQAEEVARQGEMMQQASDWSFPDGWTPPAADALDEALLPLQAGVWERMFQSTEPEIPDVGIEREARSAVYATDGDTVDVYVCPVSIDERDALFDQVETALNNAASAHTTVSSITGDTRTLYIQAHDERWTNWLVWHGGWLFSFHAADANTPIADFMTTYFEEIDAGRQDDPADPDAIPTTNDTDSAAQSIEDDPTDEAPAP